MNRVLWRIRADGTYDEREISEMIQDCTQLVRNENIEKCKLRVKIVKQLKNERSN